MTTEDLMRPRVKLIALWPGSENDGWELNKVYDVSGVGENSFENYPHLFKPLAWWEERKVEDMPEYVKRGQSVWKFVRIELHKDYPDKLLAMFFCEPKENGRYTEVTSNGAEPATLEEYNSQNK